jgi:hypothetical protein
MIDYLDFMEEGHITIDLPKFTVRIDKVLK